MVRRIKLLALAAATIGLLFVGAEANAQGRWRGGYRGGYGGYYGGYRGGVYPGGYYGGYGYGYPRGGGYPSGGGYYSTGYASSPGVYSSSPSTMYASSGGFDNCCGCECVDSSPSVVYANSDMNNSIVHSAAQSGDQAGNGNSSERITVAKPAIPDANTSAQMIKLRLPSSAEENVKYELNDHSFTMEPGYAQTFPNDRTWTIKFDDGSGNMESQELQPGNFEFVKNSDGNWELQSF